MGMVLGASLLTEEYVTDYSKTIKENQWVCNDKERVLVKKFPDLPLVYGNEETEKRTTMVDRAFSMHVIGRKEILKAIEIVTYLTFFDENRIKDGEHFSTNMRNILALMQGHIETMGEEKLTIPLRKRHDS